MIKYKDGEEISRATYTRIVEQDRNYETKKRKRKLN